MWTAPLYEPEFVRKVLDQLDQNEKTKEEERMPKITTFKKIRGLLNAVLVESPLAGDPRTFHLEKVFVKRGGVNISKKLF